MADWLTVTGMRPYDGRYELDLHHAPLTTREWGWIKRHAGYLPATMDENTFTDPEVITVLAIVAMRRAGTIETGQVADLWDRFADAPFGSTITLEAGQPDNDDDEGDAGPPPESSSSRPNINGASSQTGSDRSDGPPKRTGSPPSDTSPSDQKMSVS